MYQIYTLTILGILCKILPSACAELIIDYIACMPFKFGLGESVQFNERSIINAFKTTRKCLKISQVQNSFCGLQVETVIDKMDKKGLHMIPSNKGLLLLDHCSIWNYIVPFIIQDSIPWNLEEEGVYYHCPMMYALDLMNGHILIEVIMRADYDNLTEMSEMFCNYNVNINTESQQQKIQPQSDHKLITLILPNIRMKISIGQNMPEHGQEKPMLLDS